VAGSCEYGDEPAGSGAMQASLLYVITYVHGPRVRTYIDT
jgi:hypothetical protein